MSAGINAIAAAAGAVPHVRMIDVVFRNPFEEKTDVEVIVSRVAANDTLVTLHGHGLLIGPNADL